MRALKTFYCKYLKKYPRLHYFLSEVIYPFVFIPYGIVDYYYKTRIIKKPYFGMLFRANQLNTGRKTTMTWLIDKEFQRNKKLNNVNVLEIGSWAGSSTVIWAKTCKKYNKGKVFAIDTWHGSISEPLQMRLASKKEFVFNLFLHNIRSSNLENYVVPLRGMSDEIFSVIKNKRFDFIYIDGDHSYSKFKKDLEDYSTLVKNGGIICGDDLELTAEEADISEMIENREKGFTIDNYLKIIYHPGITLAIKDFFGKVSVKNGFWAMRKNRNSWVLVDL